MGEAVLASLLIGAGTYRVWRFIAEDSLTEPLRARLDTDGVAAYFVACQWCLGTWLAFLATLIVWLTVGLAYPVLVGLASATMTGFLASRM